MPDSSTELSETHIVGKNTREWIVRAEQCPGLRLHHIRHVGVADAAVPYRMVRTNLSGSYMLACVSGTGRIWLDGRWQVCREGWACLAPPHVLHAFHAVPKSRWGFCWVRYEQPPEQKPIISSASPVLARFDGRPLHSAIGGLCHEMAAGTEPVAIQHWIELIQNYVIRFAQPWRVDDRLWRLWEAVDHELDAPWTLDKLCRLAHCSSEHLRRLCLHQLGRSPMHQVIYLRMRRAATLLSSTDDKVGTVAHAVGYQNPFVFSSTFKKWIGWRPSEYRGQRNGRGEPAKKLRAAG